MPWRGWDKEEVLCTTAAASSNMGFTAINKTSPPATATSTEETVSRPESAEIQKVRTMASDHLGSGENQPPSEKPNGEGKKRAITTSDVCQKKRCVSNSVKDGPGISRQTFRCAQERAADKVTQPRHTKPVKLNKTSTNSSVARQDSLGRYEDEQCLSLAVDPISVYASTTSMDTLDTPAYTSLNSFKANSGQSFTLYQNQSSSASPYAGQAFFQSWLTPAVTADQNSWQDTVQQTFGMEKNYSAHPQSDISLSENAPADSRTRTGKSFTPQPTCKTPSALAEAVCARKHGSRSPKTAAQAAIDASSTRSGSIEIVQIDAASDNPDDDIMLSEVDDDDLVNFAKHIEQETDGQPATLPTRRREKNTREVEENENYGGALLSDEERALLVKFKRSGGVPKPIVRKPFQASILDRSPLFGASKSTVLRTCFRVGEALNCGSHAVRSGIDVVLELYARVTSSWREGTPSRKQYFVFRDLYHENPPHLEGTFELWDQAELWDRDSKVFLKACGKGTMCRLIAKMRRETPQWRLEILSIWEASWEDINYVAGIYG